MTLKIHMFVQLWNSLPEELKKSKAEHYTHKCKGKPFHEEKK